MAGPLLLPQLTVLNAIALLYGSLNLPSGFKEAKGDNSIGYSKFAKDSDASFPSHLGMVIAYLGGLLTAASGVVYNLPPHVVSLAAKQPQALLDIVLHDRALFVATCLFIHFLKRELEVNFLHKFSGKMERSAAYGIAFHYTLVCLFTSYMVSSVPKEVYASLGPQIDVSSFGPVPLAVVIGGSMFVVGQLGNLLHHYLLSKLRSGGVKEYKIPEAGLFSLVACPHYLFELVGWWGIAVASQHIYLVLVAMGMSSYLTGRSYATRDWYLKKFEEYPRDRKCIIPFVF